MSLFRCAGFCDVAKNTFIDTIYLLKLNLYFKLKDLLSTEEEASLQKNELFLSISSFCRTVLDLWFRCLQNVVFFKFTFH